MKYKLLLVGVCVVSVLAGVWLFRDAHTKEIVLKTQSGEVKKTKKDVLIISLTYRWNGVEDPEATWVMHPDEDGKWLVTDFGAVLARYAKARTEAERNRALKDPKTAFTYDWVEERRYQPRASRSEAVMRALGFDGRFKALMTKMRLNELFYLEREAFLSCLKLARDFDEGRLTPDGDDIEMHYKAKPDVIPVNISVNYGNWDLAPQRRPFSWAMPVLRDSHDVASLTATTATYIRMPG